MLLLTSTGDLIQVITGTGADCDVHASWVDNASGTITPGRTNTLITTATTTSVVGSPASSTQRNVKTLNIRNKDSSAQTLTVQHTDGTNVATLIKLSLQPGESLVWTEGVGWEYINSSGALVSSAILAGTSAGQSASPTGGVSTTEKAMGLGLITGFSYTPTRTGNLMVWVAGQAFNSTAAGDGVTIRGRWGTGTAPSNAATTGLGTQFSIDQRFVGSTTGGKQGFNVMGKLTALTIGVPVWIDLSLLAVTGGGASVQDVQCMIAEVL